MPAGVGDGKHRQDGRGVGSSRKVLGTVAEACRFDSTARCMMGHTCLDSGLGTGLSNQ